MTADSSKPLLFISHSVENQSLTAEFFERFERFNKSQFKIYHDRKSEAGNYNELILGKVRTCQVAVLLVSQAFIASEYCNDQEVPILMKRLKKDEVVVIPVLFQSCNFRKWNEPYELKFFQIRFDQLPNTRRSDEYSSGFNKEDVVYEEIHRSDRERYHRELSSHIENCYNARRETQLARSREHKTETSETKETEGKSSANVSQLNQEPMYRESWTNAPSSNSSPLPLQQLMTTYKQVAKFREAFNSLDSDLASFKSDLSHQVNQISAFMKDIEESLKNTGNDGHRIFRLVLEIRNRTSEMRGQLLKAGSNSAKGLDALARISSHELVYFDYSLEKLESDLRTILKEDFGIQPN